MKKPIKIQSILHVHTLEEADEIIHHLINNHIYVIATGMSRDGEGIKIEIFMEVMN